jgi:hypothetical protein
LISLATTANPLPAAPARAASIVAFSASRFVCAEMLVIVSVTFPISCADCPSPFMITEYWSTCRAARSVVACAFSELRAISPIVAVISSTTSR